MRAPARSSLLRERRGLSSVEYSLLLLLICVGALVLWKKLGDSVNCQMTTAERIFSTTLRAGSPDRAGGCKETVALGLRQAPGVSAAPGAAKPQASASQKSSAGNTRSADQPSAGRASPMPDPAHPPFSPSDAPTKVALPANVNSAMQNAYHSSFPYGVSQEQGGTIIRDAQGNIRVVNETHGAGGSFVPSRLTTTGDQILGTFHTHPYDQNEGGYTGITFSGADIAYAHYYNEPGYLDSGTKQFMIMPTQDTKPIATDTEIEDRYNVELRKQLDAGEGFEDSCRNATITVATEYNMVYYEGKNGVLVRVVP